MVGSSGAPRLLRCLAHIQQAIESTLAASYLEDTHKPATQDTSQPPPVSRTFSEEGPGLEVTNSLSEQETAPLEPQSAFSTASVQQYEIAINPPHRALIYRHSGYSLFHAR